MKRVVAITLVMLMVLAVFGGCGGAETTSSSLPESSAGESSIVTSDWPSGYPFKEGAFEGKTLTIMDTRNDSIFGEFEEATGAKIEIVKPLDLVVEVTAGIGPHIGSKGTDYVNLDINILRPVSDVLDLNEDIYKGKLNEGVVEAYSINDTVYGFGANNLTGASGPMLTIVYNKDLFEEKGLEDPYELYKAGRWSFEEFEKACKALTYDSDDDGEIDKYAVYLQYYNYGFPYYASVGGDVELIDWKEDGTPRVKITDADVVESFTFFDEIEEKYTVPYSVALPDALVDGTVAMFVHYGSWVAAPVIEALGSDGVGYVPFPYAPSNTSKEVSAFSIDTVRFFTNNLPDENIELAEEWIKYRYFWKRFDVDYEAELNKYIENRYCGNKEWYEFDKELSENAFYGNMALFGTRAYNIFHGIYSRTVDKSYEQFAKEKQPTLQYSIDTVYESIGK